jgi:hypothetical protein
LLIEFNDKYFEMALRPATFPEEFCHWIGNISNTRRNWNLNNGSSDRENRRWKQDQRIWLWIMLR